MEEKKLNELDDEALDTVTGGATYQYNCETGNYDVVDKNGNKLYSFGDEGIAKHGADRVSRAESVLDRPRQRAVKMPWKP